MMSETVDGWETVWRARIRIAVDINDISGVFCSDTTGGGGLTAGR
jgi:hypothetical protein